jgi:acylpyruvate hydrolase
MRLATFVDPDGGDLRAGDVRDNRIHPFEPGITVPDVLGGASAAASVTGIELERVRLVAPFLPRVVFGVGMNYADHLAEVGLPVPDAPALFVKGPASVTGPADPIIRPAGVTELDYEAELALVLGVGGAIAGYAVANDVSARDFRHEQQLLRHKAGDSFCPWGPWVTTADEIEDAYALRIRSWVDGDLRQDATTAEMLFRADAIVAALGRTIALQPCDVILTGTPAGVGLGQDPPRFLGAGQRVRIEIESVGSIENEVRDA